MEKTIKKIIFLDIDGVLNNYGNCSVPRSKSRCGKLLGIDKDKTKILAKIVKETDAELVLSSSWKVGWEPHKKIYSPHDYHAKYLNNHLKKKGNLILTDKTKERDLSRRGMGIKAYLAAHPEIEKWIVLDDEIFPDFEKMGILNHLIKINPYQGLTLQDADQAIKLLNN